MFAYMCVHVIIPLVVPSGVEPAVAVEDLVIAFLPPGESTAALAVVKGLRTSPSLEGLTDPTREDTGLLPAAVERELPVLVVSVSNLSFLRASMRT